MKLYFLALLSIAGLSVQASADSPWQCYKDGKVAVEIRTAQAPIHNFSKYEMVIVDSEVCRAVGVRCPFRAATGNSPFWQQKLQAAPKHFWSAIKGKSEDGVLFYSDGGGMKVIGVYTGSQPNIAPDKNWYFDTGYCRVGQGS
jgi:hypothetical protein